MGQTFFTSDTHFGHGNIIKYCNRPFLTEQEQEMIAKDDRARISKESINKMNSVIIDGINSVVGPDDTLYHLGDFMFVGNNMDEGIKIGQSILDRIACKDIIFIFGNHDNKQLLRRLFKRCYDLHEININGIKITLCHYAMVVWNCSHRGAWQLYGHSHNTIEEMMNGFFGIDRRSMDVGVDNAYRILGEYRPFSFDEIRKRFSKNEKLSD